jgi:hypothetical protein
VDIAAKASIGSVRAGIYQSVSFSASSLIVILIAALSLQAQNLSVGSIQDIDKHGNWFLYPDTNSTEGKKLARWQEVPAGGIIRNKTPNTGDYITIVDATLKVLVIKKCESLTSCYEPIILPRTLRTVPPPDEITSLFRRVREALSAEPYEPSMHRMRSAGMRLDEDVVSLMNGRVDLRKIMQHAPPGKYTLEPYEPLPTGQQTAAKKSQAVGFDWRPTISSLSVGPRKFGLYEISLAEAADIDSPVVAVSFCVLFCSSRDYAGLRGAFQQVQALTNQWAASADPETHLFLRAYLRELAKSHHIADQP